VKKKVFKREVNGEGWMEGRKERIHTEKYRERERDRQTEKVQKLRY
jgi:ribosomal protein S21